MLIIDKINFKNNLNMNKLIVMNFEDCRKRACWFIPAARVA